MSSNLKRQIGVRTATALVVGEVIAVGIFLTPASMAKSLGSPAWLLVVWVLMGVMALCGALCYAELAARYPHAGGGYVYLREAYGPAVAFVYGWMMLLVMDPGLTAALAVGIATYAAYGFNLSPLAVKAIAIGAIILVAAVNIRGVKLGAWFLRLMTFLKLGLLSFVLLWGFALRLGSWSNFLPLVSQRPNSLPLIAALATAMVGAFFSFGGWWDVSKLAGEVRDPVYTLPRALVYGVTIVTCVYILTSAAFLYLVPLEQVTSGETFAAQAGNVLFGSVGARIFSFVVVIAVLGSLAAVVMSAPRVYYAMARDGLFIPAAATIHPRYETPARAIALQAVLASALVLVGTFNQIISYFIFVVVIFIALTVAALFVLKKRPGQPPAYQTPGYPVTPLVFLLLILVLLALLGSNSPRQSFLGVAVVLTGVPIYYLFFRRRETETTITQSLES